MLWSLPDDEICPVPLLYLSSEAAVQRVLHHCLTEMLVLVDKT